MTLARRILPLAVALAAVLADPAGAATRGPAATVRSFIGAAKAHDGKRACALVDVRTSAARAHCRRTIQSGLVPLPRAQVEPGGLTQGRRARVTVAFEGLYTGNLPVATRNRVLLRRTGGRWLITDGGLPNHGPWREQAAPGPDPAPRDDATALRRLADDELLMLSGNAAMACALLAPGAPLGEADGPCGSAFVGQAIDAAAIAARARRVTIHRSGDRARLEITATVQRAVATKAKPRFRLRERRWTDTLFAVRADGRWRLAKLSRKAYDVLGVPAPGDVDLPAATATWPFADAPSLSGRPVPVACQRPPVLQGATCPELWALGAGGGIVAWTEGYTRTQTRAVTAGQGAGPVATAWSAALSDRAAWLVRDVAPVADGALVIEENDVDHAVQAVPVGPDGQPRGAAQALAPGVAESARGGSPMVVRGPAGAAVARVLLAPATLVTLGADARPVAPARALPQLDDGFLEGGGLDGGGLVVARPDGSLLGLDLGVSTSDGVDARAVGSDGRPEGVSVTQPPLPGLGVTAAPVAAVGADGRVLVAWMEDAASGRGVVRAWALDIDAPLASAPATVATLADAAALEQTLDVSALSGGGWGIAWADARTGPGAEGLFAARLDPAARPVAPPRRVTTRMQAPGAGRYAMYGLAGDTVAWVEQPGIGLQQVHAAPLP